MTRSQLGHRRRCVVGECLKSSSRPYGVVVAPQALGHVLGGLGYDSSFAICIDLLLYRCQAGWESEGLACGGGCFRFKVSFFVFWDSYVCGAPH